MSSVLILATFQAGILSASAATITKEAGIEWVSFHYEEPGVMTEDGDMIGVVASYTYDLDNMMVRASASVDFGNVGYDGWLIDVETGERLSAVKMQSPNSIMNLRIVGGPKFGIGARGLTITPLAGLGYRYLYNDLPGVGGYTREQSYWYLPVGVEAAGNFQKGWKYVARAEYNYFLSGSNESGGDSFTQSSGYGFHLSAGVSRALSGDSPISILIEPYFRYWNVDESSVTADGWLEPANNCSEYGIKCAVVF